MLGKLPLLRKYMDSQEGGAHHHPDEDAQVHTKFGRDFQAVTAELAIMRRVQGSLNVNIQETRLRHLHSKVIDKALAVCRAYEKTAAAAAALDARAAVLEGWNEGVEAAAKQAEAVEKRQAAEAKRREGSVLRIQAYRLALDAEEAIEQVVDGDADCCPGARVILSRQASDSKELGLYAGRVGVLIRRVGHPPMRAKWRVRFPGMEVYIPEVDIDCGAHGSFDLVYAVTRLQRQVRRSRFIEVEAQGIRKELENRAALTHDPVERAALVASSEQWRRKARLARRDCDREMEAVYPQLSSP